MSNQLQSMKYMPPEYLEPVTAEEVETATAPAVGQSPYASPTPMAPPANGTSLESGNWTGTMSLVAGFIAFMGGLGIIGSLWGIWSLMSLEASLETISQMATRMPQLEGSVLALEAQIENRALLMITMVLRLLVSIGFLIGSSMLKGRKVNANMFVAMVCGMAIFYNLASLVVGFMAMPDMASMPGMTAEVASVATSVALGVAGFVVLIKAGVHGSIMAYMFNKNSKALFAPKS